MDTNKKKAKIIIPHHYTFLSVICKSITDEALWKWKYWASEFCKVNKDIFTIILNRYQCN
jgi:hypothetical protein